MPRKSTFEQATGIPVDANGGIILEGDIQDRKRLVTGLYSLDHAFENVEFGEVGIPFASIELYGPTGCGKTTFSWFLAAEAGKMLNKGLTFMNIEVFDHRYLTSHLNNYGFSGKVFIAKGDSDESELDNVEAKIRDNAYCAYILDSVGAISPHAEMDGDSGSANMGRRAKLMAAHMRKLNHYSRDKDLLSIIINHVHPRLGSVGTVTTGGETIKYLCANRVKVKRQMEFKDGSFTLEGKVVKNRFGVEDRLFWVFILSGRGIHRGMSAFYDCYQYELVKKPKGKQTFQWVDERLPGFTYPSLVAAARAGDDAVFTPFLEALNSDKPVAQDVHEDGEDSGE